MNYKNVNTAILKSTDIPKSIKKDAVFYEYLFGNSVAYYYAKQLAKDRNTMDKRIINAGEKLNSKFIKSVKLIHTVCKENKIQFLLFKTYKYVPEVVDNDIDLFVKKKDFYKFMKALALQDFHCFENEPLKGICQKEGFCKIEPRVSFSFRGREVLQVKKIWEKVEPVTIGGLKIFKTTKEIDLLHFLLSILYNPNYLKLYTFRIYREIDTGKLYTLSHNKNINQDLKFLFRCLITGNLETKRFPVFLTNAHFTRWWFQKILTKFDITFSEKIRLILAFFYIKYSYLVFHKLAFKHSWNI